MYSISHGEDAITSKPVRKASLLKDRPELGPCSSQNLCLPETEQLGMKNRDQNPPAWVQILGSCEESMTTPS